jgi:hypothetical protein
VAYQVYKKKVEDKTTDNSAYQRPFQHWREQVFAKTVAKGVKKRKTSADGSQAHGKPKRLAPIMPAGDPTEAQVKACLPPQGYKVYQDCTNNRCYMHTYLIHQY